MQKVEFILLPFATKSLPRHFNLSKPTIGVIFLSLLSILILSAYVLLDQATNLYHNWQLANLNKDHVGLLDSLYCFRENARLMYLDLVEKEQTLKEISIITETNLTQNVEPRVLNRSFFPWEEMQDMSDAFKLTHLFPVEGIEKTASDKVNAVWQALRQVENRMDFHFKWADNCYRDMKTKFDQWSHIPSILPAEGAITCYFGERRSPFGGPRVEHHRGVDVAGPIGLPLKAAADGIVFFAGCMPGYGNLVIIDHENGFYSYYGHCSLLKVVEGQKVKRYQTIALLGSTGRSTGPHVHFEIREGNQPANPFHFIEEEG